MIERRNSAIGLFLLRLVGSIIMGAIVGYYAAKGLIEAGPLVGICSDYWICDTYGYWFGLLIGIPVGLILINKLRRCPQGSYFAISGGAFAGFFLGNAIMLLGIVDYLVGLLELANIEWLSWIFNSKPFYIIFSFAGAMVAYHLSLSSSEKMMLRHKHWCAECGGAMEEKRITHEERDEKGMLYLFENVPAWVCSQCGHVYLDAKVDAQLDQLIAHGTPSKRVQVDLFDFAESAVQN